MINSILNSFCLFLIKIIFIILDMKDTISNKFDSSTPCKLNDINFISKKIVRRKITLIMVIDIRNKKFIQEHNRKNYNKLIL
jgi:hypothetical protein